MDRIEASRILGIDPSADEDTARAAYRQLIHAVHPDRGGDPVMFELVQEAWVALRSPLPAPQPPAETPSPESNATAERVHSALGQLSVGCGTTVIFWTAAAVLVFVVATIRELAL
jgi:hypothetical protein